MQAKSELRKSISAYVPETEMLPARLRLHACREKPLSVLYAAFAAQLYFNAPAEEARFGGIEYLSCRNDFMQGTIKFPQIY